MPANLELSCGHRSGKGQFSFQSQRRAMPKNVQTSTQLYSFHMLARPCSKSSKLAFNSIWTENFQMEKLCGRIQCPSVSNSRAVTAPNSEDRKTTLNCLRERASWGRLPEKLQTLHRGAQGNKVSTLGVEKKWTFLHHWWECKLVQLLWKNGMKIPQKTKIEIPYDPATPLLGIYPDKTIIQKDTWNPMFIAALFGNNQDTEAT